MVVITSRRNAFYDNSFLPIDNWSIFNLSLLPLQWNTFIAVGIALKPSRPQFAGWSWFLQWPPGLVVFLSLSNQLLGFIIVLRY